MASHEIWGCRDETFSWLGYNTLHTNNSIISGGSTWGSSITVKIGNVSKTLTIPSNPNIDTKVTHNSNADNSDYRMLLQYFANDTNETQTVKYNTNPKYNTIICYQKNLSAALLISFKSF